MSRTIEENIVKMRFDNSDFNKNVESSEQSINKFKTALVSLPSTALLGLSNALRNVNLSDVLGIGAALTGIKLVKAGISGIGNTVEGICATSLSAIGNVFEKTMSQIKTGGMNRALNIEAAKFQIEGLELDVETFMEAADYAVSGTAYTLDAAAKAASQLGASGVTELEDLKKALRAVSGTAAMTNSSYEEIAHIFTTVAGQGRVTSNTLESLSVRGLNAAAVMGKFLKKTEAEIRDMVSHGQIDFATFALAMDEAFGQHAKDANKTFSGSLANINAALSKIGEKFATPYIQNMIDLHNALRESINQLKEELDLYNVFQTFSDDLEIVISRLTKFTESLKDALHETVFIKEASSLITYIFDKVTEVFDAFTTDYSFVINNILTNLSSVFSVAKGILQILFDSFDAVFGIRQVGADFISTVTWASGFLTKFAQKFFEYEDDLRSVAESWFKTIKEVFGIFKEVLGIDRSSFENLFDGAVKDLFEFLKGLLISDERMEKIKSTARGFASGLDIVVRIAQNVWRIIKQIFGYLPAARDTVEGMSASIGDWVTKLRATVIEQGTIEKVFDRISKIVEFISKFLGGIGTTFVDAFFGDENKGKGFLSRIKQFAVDVKAALKELFQDFDWGDMSLKPINDFFSEILGLDEVTESNTEEAEEKKSLIQRVFEFFGEVFDTIKSFFDSEPSTSSVKTNLNAAGSSGGIIGIIETVGALISGVLEDSKNFINGISISPGEAVFMAFIFKTLVDAIKEILIRFIGFAETVAKYSIVAIASEGTLTSIKKFFDSLNFDSLGNFFKKLGNINLDVAEIVHGKEKTSELFTSLALFIGAIGLSLVFLSSKKTDIEKVKTAAEILKDMIVTVGVLLVVLRIIGGILPNMSQSLGKINNSIGTVTASLIGARNNVGNVNKFISLQSDGIFSDLSESIEALTIGIAAIAIALKIVSKIEPDKLKHDALILGLMILEVFGLVALMMKLVSDNDIDTNIFYRVKEAFIGLGVAIVLIAASLKIITKNLEVDELGKLWTAFGVIAILLGEMALVIFLLAKFSNDTKDVIVGGASVFVSAIGMFIMLSALAKVITSLATLDEGQLKKVNKTILILLGAMTLAVALMTIVGAMAGKSEMAVLGILAVGLLLVEVASVFLALGAFLQGASNLLASIRELLKVFKEVSEYFKSLDEGDVKKILKTMMLLSGGMFASIMRGITNSLGELELMLLRVLPIIGNTINGVLIPFLVNSILSVIPSINKAIVDFILEVLKDVVAYYPKFSDVLYQLLLMEILPDIFKWSDKIWDDTTEWLKNRIPVVVPDIIELTLLLLQTINDAMEGNWDKFDEELQELIDNSIQLIRDLLTGEKTWEDINGMFTDILEHIKKVFEDNKDEISAAFGEMGKTLGQSLIEGIKGMFSDFSWSDLINDDEEVEIDDSSIMNPHKKSNKTNLNTSSDSDAGDLWNSIKNGWNKVKEFGTNPEEAIEGLTENSGINEYTKDFEDFKDELTNGDIFDSSLNGKSNTSVNVVLHGDARDFFKAETKYKNRLIRSGSY